MTRAFRPINLLVIACVCIAFQVVSFKIQQSQFQLTTEFLVYILVALFIGAGGYLINGFYDQKIDGYNLPEYSFPFERNQVILIYSLLNILPITLGLFFLDISALIGFILLPILLLWAYSAWLKALPIIGNGIVAFIALWLPIGLLYVNGSSELLGNDLYAEFVMLMLGEIFLITFAREIIKDIEDVEGDKKYHCKTLPVRLGEKKAAYVASFFLFWSALLWFGTVKKHLAELNLLTLLFCIFTFVIVIISFVSLWRSTSWKNRAKQSSLLLKVGMLVALTTLISI
ncbi:UbiA family prenyltransferase [Parvicella tangerina]|uniref:Prenyltransferase n=1 Tax=Parvicella tangerina TaxID=2829795 RepID=A0A916NRA9_9FLAO|nr:UbiA family prenyltransferase [Parvicella tangerina]CAG5080732.1 hypothetical protein CRYO30217_01430 [Parvicella tangerina]